MPIQLIYENVALPLHPNGAGVVVPSAPPLGSVFGKGRLLWIADVRQ